MYSKRIIVIGARRSILSVTQAEEVITPLKKLYPLLKFVIKKITTKGDRIKGNLPKEKRVFVKEIEDALIKGKIDVAVHSLKDLPVSLPKGLILGAVMKRKSPYDIFIPKKGEDFFQLKRGAVIGTSSLRRKAQILCLRKDIKTVDLRGNIDTRLKKLNEQNFDGIICAQCALMRLRVKLTGQRLPLRYFLPSPGQGALGIEVRKEDPFIKRIVKRINHKPTYLCVRAERDFVAYLGGGCRLPIGAFARIKNDRLGLRGFVSNWEASSVICVKREVPLRRAAAIGKLLAQEAINKGALKILGELR